MSTLSSSIPLFGSLPEPRLATAFAQPQSNPLAPASLFVTLHLTRLVCKNGMTAPVPDAMLLRRRHRGLDGAKLTELLASQMQGLPGRLREGADILVRSTARRVADPPTELHAILDAANLPGRLLPALLVAYEREPTPTAFGISQAVTLAAQGMRPEDRVDLEQAVGAYLGA